jgi:hypothetical protein
MRRWNMPVLATITCLLGGCNQPAVSLKAPAFQSSENTVRDWNDVAHKVASEMALRGLLPSPGLSVSPNVRPVYVRVQAPDSTFLHEVADELAADILNSGASLALTPSGATVVNLDVDFVRWSPRDKPPGLLGSAAAVAAIPGIVIAASVPMSTWAAADAAAFSAAGLGLLTDAVIAMTPMTNAEAIWKATIITGDRVVMKLREPVYIRDADIPLYAKMTSLIPIASWSDTNRPLAVRSLRYVE